MNPPSTHLRARLTAGAAVALCLLAVGAASASAHVRVKPDSTASGSYAGLTFRVPNESDTASTTKVVLTLPQDQPFRHVSVRPVPGWTAKVAEAALPTPVTADGSTITKAARTVTWTASAGAAIAPGQYQEFSVSAGPLPAPGTLVLPVTQSYSDGEVVDWATPQAPGESEPEHPAPQFEVTAAASPAASGTASGSTGAATGAATGSGGASAETDDRAAAQAGENPVDPVARGLAGGALLVGLAVLALQLGAHRRRRVAA